MTTETGKKKRSRYDEVIEAIFLKHHTDDSIRVFDFIRDEINGTAQELGLTPIKNPGDAIYSFRSRTEPPIAIQQVTPKGWEWIIEGTAKGKYQFRLVREFSAEPAKHCPETKILEATPGIVAMYATSDEQALLAKLRYNRLIDTFTSLTCYSLQNHFRTTIHGGIQAEVDEVYVGLDKRGVHYALSIEAKRKKEKLGNYQVRTGLQVCQQKFPAAISKTIGAQEMEKTLIALFDFEVTSEKISILNEKHYRLVNELTTDDLNKYGRRPE